MGKVSKNNKNNNKKSKNKNNKKIKKILKILVITIIVLIIIMVGVFAGIIFGLFGGEYAITKEDLIINYSNSIVVDQDDNIIATLSATENRKILTKDEMGKFLPKAFVSIEDQRFYKHGGVDWGRTAKAILTFAFNKGESSFGGSTITQQLVKNITNEKEDSGVAGAMRKVKEITRAYQVESILSKDQILELYMNIIFLGGTVYGVGMASEYYFDKDATNLSLAESAFIAGITHSPNSYKPFAKKPNTYDINKRTKTVLNKMKELGNITDEQYNLAIEEVNSGLKFKRGETTQSTYSSHTEALIDQVIDELVAEKGIEKEYAKTYLFSSGLKIYSTEKASIQGSMEKEYSKKTYMTKSRTTKNDDGKYVTAQSAMVIIDHSNGYVVGCTGNLGEQGAFELNRATQSERQPGSSIKPIGVYGPALQEGEITAASVYDDTPVKYGTYTPNNSYGGYKGLTNMRQAIRTSSNIIAVKVLDDLSPKKSIEYLKDLGITSLHKEKDENLSLALGGVTTGITPLEMAAAYAAIANDGEYISPTFYIKIEDSEGKTILEPKQSKKRVFSKENAYILKELLTEPTKTGGTATNCKISNMETAAKTGTTNSNKDKWLCGFTPYYAAATWYGFDKPETVYNPKYASIIWKNVMADIHKGLKKASFKKPSNVKTATVCKDSGLIATDLCKNDQRGSRVYTEYFVKGAVPKKTCTCHIEAEICKTSGKIANENCQNKETKIFITRATDSTAWKKAGDAKYMLPEDKCEEKETISSAPSIILNGTENITLKLDEAYTELGAKATDAIDGDITDKIVITGTVNNKVKGTYKITYTVTNTQGKTTTVIRTIVVKDEQTNIVTNTNTNESTGANTNENQL